MYENPKWTGTVNRLRIQFDNTDPGATVGIQAIFTQFDTRHNINQANFVRGCAKYFNWTGDVNFLRANINRMRTALRYDMTEFQAATQHVILTPWVGHEGRSGVVQETEGKKTILPGEGIGNNYWDLLPFGYKDAYATIQHYDAALRLAELERAVRDHPEWDIPRGVLAFDPDELETHAAQVKKTGNKLFWNKTTGRFVAAVDKDGATYDYGFTFLNLEAIYYGFATDAHAKSIVAWINGDRTVAGDTSQGADIYHWRFGPRSTTKRNIGYYAFPWSGPESIPWGGQVQDGGAVLGFSYHDLMARLAVKGPDNVAGRLGEIAKWYDEAMAAGGYRKYYDGSREGTMQGSGTAGGLGLDMEFFERVLVPQVLIDGFLGVRAKPNGLYLDPCLPADWPELTITRIAYRNAVLAIRATRDQVEVTVESVMQPAAESLGILWPAQSWQLKEIKGTSPGVSHALAPSGVALRKPEPCTIVLTRATGRH